MVDKSDLREQFVDAFEDADYPVSNVMDLLPALPDGPSTTFESEEFSMTAMELNARLDGNFPYESPEAFADDIISQLESQDEL